MLFYVGTSGYSFREWKGSFYPEELAARDMLRFYGANLPAVEINATFYAMPRAKVLAAWAEQVPADFRFALKAPRKITHTRPLKEKGEGVGYLLRTAAILGDKLGAILFQLPPHLRKQSGLLADFIALLPSGTRAAFEFRHPSWFDDEVYQKLHEKGCALCWAESEREELSRLVATADWGYLRLRKPNYSATELLAWTQKIKAQNWQAVFAFFKHEKAGLSPALARHFLDLMKSE